MQLNDAIRAAVGPGHLSTGLLRYYQANGATSNDITDAKMEWLDAVYPLGVNADVNDKYFEYLGSLGHTGSINDRELQYWQTITPATSLITSFAVTGTDATNTGSALPRGFILSQIDANTIVRGEMHFAIPLAVGLRYILSGTITMDEGLYEIVHPDINNGDIITLNSLPILLEVTGILAVTQIDAVRQTYPAIGILNALTVHPEDAVAHGEAAVQFLATKCGLTRSQVRKIIRKTRRGRPPATIALQLGLPIEDVMCVVNKLP